MIATGALVDNYEIEELIGSGGMGEVYRARDRRIDRRVAIKILSPSFAVQDGALGRFEQEARVVGSMNHPNLVTLYDIGVHEGAPYLAMELLEGSTLRAHLDGGALPLRKALDIAAQVASGLSAAHEKKIVHRDLKPENIFVTSDGHVKILDFGLAKMTAVSPTDITVMRNVAATNPGMILGTVGYMSPEQVRGEAVDVRTDIFSFGSVLYEMLSGRKAFHGTSAADTLSAILKEEPPELTLTQQTVTPAVEHIVRRCLAKPPADRYQSARDLAFDLDLVRSGSLTTRRWLGLRRRSWLRTALEIGLATAVIVLAVLLASRGTSTPPSFRRVTFGRGVIGNAKFTPGGESFIYGAGWGGDPYQLYEGRFDNAEARPTHLIDFDVQSISRNGEMAILSGGDLARIPIAGGSPRPIASGIANAWWLPDGKQLAVARRVGGRTRIEYPLGKGIFETSDTVDAALSHKADRFALVLGPINTFGGAIAVLETNGKLRELSPGWSHIHGVVWSPNDREIWFTAARVGSERSLWAVNLDGKLRLLARAAGALSILDVAPDGRVLISRMDRSSRVQVSTPDKTIDVSWLDFSRFADMSADGKKVLFTELGEGGGEQHAVYLRGVDGSPATRLGDGVALALSPNGTLAATMLEKDLSQIILLPVGAGEPKAMPRSRIQHISAMWHPDGKRLIVRGADAGHAERSWIEDFSGGLRPLTPPNQRCTAISPDGKQCLANPDQNRIYLYPIGGGERQEVRGFPSDYAAIGFMNGGKLVAVPKGVSVRTHPVEIKTFDIPTGRLAPLRTLTVGDPVGAQNIEIIANSADGKTIAFSFRRFVSDLYLLEGLPRH